MVWNEFWIHFHQSLRFLPQMHSMYCNLDQINVYIILEMLTKLSAWTPMSIICRWSNSL